MAIHELAGKTVPPELLTNIPRLISDYYTIQPDPTQKEQLVAFGTSGHRGVSSDGTFNEEHILAIVQAIVDYRKEQNINGPVFVGMDTHALSEAALTTTIQVLSANKVECYIQEGLGYTPTPVVSHAILTYNKDRQDELADGIIITPSHNPPDNGGIKYNPTNGGPADTNITSWIADKANGYLKAGVSAIKTLGKEEAFKANTTISYDYMMPYIKDLKNIIDMKAIQKAGLKLGADAMGGAGLAYWELIAKEYDLDMEVIHNHPMPAFEFMSVDKDGKVRMDCSSPYAMASLIHLKDKYDLAFGNDPDFDRHGIVTKSAGLMNPNHYLAVAIQYLFNNRPQWKKDTAIGKTLVSSSMIDKVAQKLGKDLKEVPVGFKWFVSGLIDGSYGFGGEESAGASFLRFDGTVWSTDKDGIILCLLAAEILAVTGKDPGEHYQDLIKEFGSPLYQRNDAPATLEEKARLKKLSPDQVQATELAGHRIIQKLTEAPGNGAAIGGLKVVTDKGWFAARPSGTENIYKIYAESFVDQNHLDRIIQEATQIVKEALH
ncbi:phosphoglucomutase (alpha-D-glucose-1,6-bisphosphate-dependent) [Spirochaeta cellobiosiphila]|uniref:phosphoglucomutase (alpha-D-glucose-1,6-bisphosphate-dependent) n=1 Tax=Spirochaeta cellobiosiphila TaxID=504483 RepID=UPI00040254F7|nr:phosphoglucomutase (alpha-D-glucose-1,6-bisphosphate-dependent) [Spirochaeta cellobiosiphila]